MKTSPIKSSNVPATQLTLHRHIPATLHVFLILLITLLLSDDPLHAQDCPGVDCPTTLTNELTGKAIGPDTHKLIILVHGWNPGGGHPYLSEAGELPRLANSLKSALANSDWQLVFYSWENDANTGPSLSLDALQNAIESAEHAQLHGPHVARLLLKNAPNLERVHFICHSAGSWVARFGLEELCKSNQTVRGQLTLLDPFVPGRLRSSHTLQVGRMNDLATVPQADQLYLLENYYSSRGSDLSFGTEGSLQWRSIDISDGDVTWADPNPIFPLVYHYTDHDGPIQFYEDTIDTSHPGTALPRRLEHFRDELDHLGWRRSAFMREPRFTQQPSDQTLLLGGTVTLRAPVKSRFEALVNRPDSQNSPSIQWFKDNVALPGQTTATLTLSHLTAADAGYYHCVASNAAGLATSRKALLYQPATFILGEGVPLPTPGAQGGVAVTDLDGDGKPEVLSTASQSDLLVVFASKTAGSPITAAAFGEVLRLPAGRDPLRIATGDLNGDNRPEVAVVAPYTGLMIFPNTSFLPGNPHALLGNFTAFTSGPGTPSADVNDVKMADIDNDGQLDLVVVNNKAHSLSIFRNPGGAGSGTIPKFDKFDIPAGSNPVHAALGDLDGDGKPDLVVGHQFGPSVTVIRNGYQGGLLTPAAFDHSFDLKTGQGQQTPVIADLDGDGWQDIAVAARDAGTVAVFRNQGGKSPLSAGRFPVHTLVSSTVSGPFSLLARDLNRDGRPELITANFTGGRVTVFQNATRPGIIEDNSFLVTDTFGLQGASALGADVGDLNNDGRGEIAVATYGSLYVLENAPAPVLAVPQLVIPSLTLSEGFSLTASLAAGVSYRLEYSTDLETWLLVKEYLGHGAAAQLRDEAARREPSRFYRVRVAE